MIGAPHDGLAHVTCTQHFEPTDETIGEALARLSSQAGGTPAIMWATEEGARHLTWSELNDRAQRGAATLQRINPHRGRVAVAALNSVDWVVAMFACAIAGMPIVPISASGTDDEMRYQIEHARVSTVLAATAAGEHRVLEQLRNLCAFLRPPPAAHDISKICSSTAHLTPVTISPDDEFLAQYTSGTTGRPKAAILSHRVALDSAAVFMRAVGAETGDRYLNPLPLHHVGGSVTGVLAALAISGTYIFVERFSPEALLSAFRQAQPALAGLVPTMMIDLLAMSGVTPADFSGLRTVMGGAAAVDPALICEMENRLGANVVGSYGQSEAPAITATSPGDSHRVRTQTIGRCLAGRDIVIRDRAGMIVSTGEVGELYVRGPLTMSGYLRSDGELDPAVDSDGWRGTGDLCSMDSDGIVTFRGRTREVVIRGGLNVYPAEVEQALSTHETVSEIAVFGVPDPRLGERVVAAVIPAPHATVDIAELTTLAATRLSSYKRPAEWVVVRTLPRTSTGKVRKHVLRTWHESGTLGTNCSGAQRD
jgi:fatty-acyl-CoA synthase